MFGREEVARLRQQKQVLLLESDLNRLKLQVECRTLTQGATSLAGAGRLLPRSWGLMLVLAPIAGLLLGRGVRGSESWFSRLVSSARWLVPLYQLWKSLSK
jgi:hypothetical protein